MTEPRSMETASRTWPPASPLAPVAFLRLPSISYRPAAYRWQPSVAAGVVCMLLLCWQVWYRHTDDVLSLLTLGATPTLRGPPPACSMAWPSAQSPALVVGLPKTGTSSIRAFFECGGFSVSHWTCGLINGTRGARRMPFMGRTERLQFCGNCVRENLRRARPALLGCGDYAVYSQLDHISTPDACFLPQVSALDALTKHFPNATLILNVRSPAHWLRSIKSWYRGDSMAVRIANCNLPGLLSGSDGDLMAWYVQHIRRVRHFATTRPCNRLVEVNIEDESAGSTMHEAFPFVTASCWGRVNVNRNRRDRS
mmetsp:Transcript_8525/g.17291  ORF Transcript_8525/g.17291 Transcript_8525/m.17291 type:complete len:311 (-) Transcript_8525:93-1025(-)